MNSFAECSAWYSLFTFRLNSGMLVLGAPASPASCRTPVVPVVQVLALQLVILLEFSVRPGYQLQRRMEFRNRSLLDLSGAMVGSATTLTMALWVQACGRSLRAPCLERCGEPSGSIGFPPFVRWPDFSVKGMRPLLKFGGHITAARHFRHVLRADRRHHLRQAARQRESRLLCGCLEPGVVTKPENRGLINGVAFPAFSSMQHDIRKVRENVQLGVGVLSFFAFPVAWGMSSIAPEIVEVILGPKWVLATIPLQALALIMPLRIMGNFVGIAVQGLGRPDIALRNTIWASIIGPPVLVAGAYSGQLIGLSSAWLVVSFTLLFSLSPAQCAGDRPSRKRGPRGNDARSGSHWSCMSPLRRSGTWWLTAMERSAWRF